MVKSWQQRIAVAGLMLAVLGAGNPASGQEKKERAQNLYRYHNQEGVPVINDNVPPEFAGAGYEVLAPSGRVIEVVPPVAASPSLPPAAAGESGTAAASSATDDAGASTVAGAAVSEREDKFLLASYSTVQDIAAAKQRKLAQFQREIDVAKANLDRTLQRKGALQAQADGARQAGREPPAAVLTSLGELDVEKANGEQLVHQREHEYRDAASLYDRYAARFRALKATPPAAAARKASGSDEVPTPDQQ
jgi:hypothetical protein